MTRRHQSPSYDELLREFKVALNRVLSGSVLPPVDAISDAPLTVALLDIAYAAREGLPTNYLVSRACFLFSRFAATAEAESPLTPAGHLNRVP